MNEKQESAGPQPSKLRLKFGQTAAKIVKFDTSRKAPAAPGGLQKQQSTIIDKSPTGDLTDSKSQPQLKNKLSRTVTGVDKIKNVHQNQLVPDQTQEYRRPPEQESSLMFDNLLGEADQHNAYLDLSRDSNPFVSSQVIQNREGNYLTGGGNLANSIDNYGSFTSLTQIVGKTKPKLKQGTKINAKPSTAWKKKIDQNKIYNIEKRLTFSPVKDAHRDAIIVWRNNDIKGNRQTSYMKEVQNRNSNILTIVNQSRLEKVHNYTDGHKCLNFRKDIMRCRVKISDACIVITKNRYFESFIILIIGLNCITLAQSDNTVDETPLQANIELAFQAIYTVEMFLRIFSLGFVVNKDAYLRSYWNQLDFVCVVSGFVGIIGGGDTSLASIRAFRVLRPLRTINQIEGLRSVVQSVVSAVALLQDTILILIFFMLIFAIGGLNLFMGLLMQRCVDENTGDALKDDEGSEIICGYADCPTGYYCGKKTLNPSNDVTNFDNILWALLNVFQCLTLEGWSDIMVMYQKAYTPFVFFFFVSLVFIGAFFFLNLTLAVINSQYSQTQARFKAQKERLRAEQNEILQAAQRGDQDALTLKQQKKKQIASGNLGVAEFFIAKRAAQKLIAFQRHYSKVQSEQEEAQKQQVKEEKQKLKEMEQEEFTRRQQLLKSKREKQKQLKRQTSSGGFNSSTNNGDRSGLNESQKNLLLSKDDYFKDGQSLNASDDGSSGMADWREQELIKEVQNSIKVMPITEESAPSDDEDDAYQEEVLKFLDTVNKKPRNAKDSTSEKPDELLRRSMHKSPSIVNAFNDMRISGASPLKQVNDSNSRMKNAPSLKNIATLAHSASKNKTLNQQNNETEGEGAAVEQDLQNLWMLKDLDFDKIVKSIDDDIAQKPEDKKLDSGSDEKEDQIGTIEPRKGMIESPDYNDYKAAVTPVDTNRFNMSHAKDFYKHKENQLISIEDNKQMTQEDLEQLDQDDGSGAEFISSIISSDESYVDKMKEYKSNKMMADPEKAKKSPSKLRIQQKSKDLDRQLQRMLSTDFLKYQSEDQSMNQSASAMSISDNIPGLKKQVDLMQSLQLDLKDTKSNKRGINSERKGKESMLTMNTNRSNDDGVSMGKSARARKNETVKVYQQVENYFQSEQPSNPMEFIDKNKQKVIINPGVPYISTSINEIFAHRNEQKEAENVKAVNPFISVQAKKESETAAEMYRTEIEESYIFSSFEPYQLKTISHAQQIEEVDWDNEEEDALILQHQPFETIMQTGFKDYLNHLNTRFIARRSDIIVSSTLSFTMAPQDDGFVPQSFCNIDNNELQDYVHKRNKYRSFKIDSNIIPRAKRATYYDTSVEEIEMISESEEENSEEEEQFQMKKSGLKDAPLQRQLSSIRRMGGIQDQKIRLPDTLLTEPLQPNMAARLREKDKKAYNLQRSKYDVTLKLIARRPIKPKDHTFSLEDAKTLIDGLYYIDEEDSKDDQEKDAQRQNQDGQQISRAMQSTVSKFKNELNLENFDEIEQLIEDEQMKESSVDPRNQIDHIPNDIKKAFQLPDDMSNLDLDFLEVRKVDAQFKKRTPVWSGQDVLDSALNMAKSQWVLNQMNEIRVWPKGIYNQIKKARSVLKAFTRTNIFNTAMTLSVLVNTVGMAMESYDIKEEQQADLDLMNEIFTWIFIAEMCMKLLARGPKKYSAERMNLLDGGVVILSIVEMIITAQGGEGGAGNLQAFRTVRVFRTFRVLRVTRILRSLKSMAMIIGVISHAFMDFIWISLLMFVFIFIYTLLGRQIFQGKYDFGPDEELPRGNYESFYVAFITVFQVFTMENWQFVLFGSLKAAEGSMIFKTITALFYISWIFIGNFILLNLFLAILIDSFGEADAEMELDESERTQAEEDYMIKHQRKLKIEKQKRMKNLGASVNDMNRIKNLKTEKIKVVMKKQKASFTGRKTIGEDLIDDVEDLDNQAIRLILIEQGLLKAKKGEIDEKNIGPEIEAENSIYLFNRTSCFRRNIFYIQKHRYFERIIILLIALSSAKLATESYFVDEPDDSMFNRVSEDLDYAFNFAFIFECILKVIALGFAMDNESYLRDSWNGLDFFIVVISVVDMSLSSTDIPALKVLRLLRMIRPLRVISHNAELKMIVAALFESVGSIINVSFVVLIIWLMFAIYGMNTYMGMFFYCSVDKYKNYSEWVCADAGGEWKRFDSNFDNIGEAMMTLFIVSSLEGWPDIMYQAIDITKRDNGPKYENSPGHMIFFIVFIMIGSFFFLNFFIGVLFLNYEHAQKKEEAGYSKDQLYWLELQRLIVQAETPHELRYKPQENPRLAVWKIVQSDTFEVVIMICIVLNMLQMALDYEGAGPGMLMFLTVSNYFFTAVFLIECIIKLYVYRLPYFKTAWNKFDFFVVTCSLIDLGIELALPTPEGGNESNDNQILSVGPQLARVLRVLRVSRVLRLANKYKGLQSLLKTIQMSVSSLINVFILLMLIFFIMAVLGNSLFYKVTEGDVIDEWKNFTNFHLSFELLFSISTGEDWNRIMYDCMNTSSDCIEGKTCGTDLAPLFFLSFILIVTHVMLNLFVLVIIQQFTKYYIDADNPRVRFETDFEGFKEAWRHGSGRYQAIKLKVKQVNLFFRKLPNRMLQKMNIRENAKEMDVNRTIIQMGINVDDGFVYFNEMLYRVMRAQYGKVKFNKVMALNELVTQYRVAELTLKAQDNGKMNREHREEAFFNSFRAAPVNPFLTRMFYKSSFKAWRSFMFNYVAKKNWEQKVEEDRKHYANVGKTFVEPVYQEPEKLMEEVDIEREELLEITCSSDENFVDDEKSFKAASIDKKSSSQALISEKPQKFRHRARTRIFMKDLRSSVNLNANKDESQNKNKFDQQFFQTMKSSKPRMEKDKRLKQMNSEVMYRTQVTKKLSLDDDQAIETERMASKVNKLEKMRLQRSSTLPSVMEEDYKGSYANKQARPTPSAGLNGPYQQQKKARISVSKLE